MKWGWGSISSQHCSHLFSSMPHSQKYGIFILRHQGRRYYYTEGIYKEFGSIGRYTAQSNYISLYNCAYYSQWSYCSRETSLYLRQAILFACSSSLVVSWVHITFSTAMTWNGTLSLVFRKIIKCRFLCMRIFFLQKRTFSIRF